MGPSQLGRALRAVDLFTDLLRLVALASLLAAVLAHPLTAVIDFAVVLVILLVPRIAALPRPVDAAVGITWLVAGWANAAGWYQALGWLDFVVHGSTTGATAAAVYLLLVRAGLVPPLQDLDIRRSGIVVLVTALAMAVGVLWEFYEWIVYRNLPGRDFVGYTDTVADLLMDTVSGMLAGVGLAVWASFGWRTRRLRVRDLTPATRPERA